MDSNAIKINSRAAFGKGALMYLDTAVQKYGMEAVFDNDKHFVEPVPGRYQIKLNFILNKLILALNYVLPGNITTSAGVIRHLYSVYPLTDFERSMIEPTLFGRFYLTDDQSSDLVDNWLSCIRKPHSSVRSSSMSAKTYEIETPRFTSKLIAKGGRKMRIDNAVKMYGVMDVLASLNHCIKPSELGMQYALHVERILTAKIVKHNGVEIPEALELNYPRYTTTMGEFYNDTLTKLYLLALDIGVSEEILHNGLFPLSFLYTPSTAGDVPVSYIRCLQDEDSGFFIDASKSGGYHERHPDNQARQTERTNTKPALERNLKPAIARDLKPVNTFGSWYESVDESRTIQSLKAFAAYCSPLVVDDSKYGSIWSFAAGQERYLLIRGTRGGMIFDSQGGIEPLYVTGFKPEDSLWHNVKLMEVIHDTLFVGDILSLLVATADLPLCGTDADLEVLRMGRIMIESYTR
jgi:hypothetical protein